MMPLTSHVAGGEAGAELIGTWRAGQRRQAKRQQRRDRADGRGAGPQAEAPGAGTAERLPVEAELARDLPVDLGDAHPDVDLDGAEYGQVVDHAALVADIAAGDCLRLLRRGGGRHRAGQDRRRFPAACTRTPDAPCTVRAIAAWIAAPVAGVTPVAAAAPRCRWDRSRMPGRPA